MRLTTRTCLTFNTGIHGSRDLTAIATSKSRQLYLLLKERIVSGSLLPGHQLPSEPNLAVAHNLSRMTIRRALDGLARDGLIQRRAGSGTYVRDSAATPPLVGDLSNMLQSLTEMGKTTQVKLLAFSYGVPPAPVAEALELASGERTQHSIRVRSMDNTPFSYLSTHVPERIGVSYSEADLATRPLLSLLERSGIVAVEAGQTISATLAGPEVAKALQVEVGSALIALTRIVRGSDGRGVEHLSALYRPDRHQFHMALTRAGEAADRHWLPTRRDLSQPAGRRGVSSQRRRP
ncbi:MAG: GntR family transcriptional regulator [Beijerinckiaceae bacterium]